MKNMTGIDGVFVLVLSGTNVQTGEEVAVKLVC